MDHDLLLKALIAAKKGKKYAFATVIKTTPKGTPQKSGAKMVVLEDGTIYGTIGGGRNEKSAQKECLKSIKSEESKTVVYNFFGQKGQSVCGGQMEVFIEPVSIPHHLIICGGGHIGLPLAAIAKLQDFKVTLIDNRKEFANKRRFSFVDKVICGNYASILGKLAIDKKSYIMIVTQGNEHDFKCLKKALKSSANYIGVISSQAKRIKFFNRLKTSGSRQSTLKRIKIPAGIDVGAKTPAEIATSIMAEILKVKNKKHIGSGKFIQK